MAAVDWDFVARSARKSPFSTFHWYPGQLISQIPATLIGLLSNIGDTVVDPFAGSGSVVTEAQRLGRRAVAMDINPIATQIIAAKTLSCNATQFKRISSGMRAEIAPILGHDLASLQHSELAPTSPASVQLSKWYSAPIGAKLTRLWSFCEAQIGERRVICDAVFSSILMAACRETRSWGYVCDNVQPKDEASGEDRDLFALVAASLGKLESGYVERERSSEALGGRTAEFSAVQCITESALTAFDQLGKDRACLEKCLA